MSKFSESIKKHRKAKGLTQNQLAQKLYVTKQAISKWETGSGYPDTSTLPTLAKLLDISIDELMGENQELIKKSILRKVFLLISSSVMIISLSILFYISLNIENLDIQPINEIEQKVGINFPNHGKFVSSNFEDWLIYGNSIQIKKMSYIVFSKNSEIEKFEDSIEQNEFWTIQFSTDLELLIPDGIKIYSIIGDYYLLCNTSSNLYNQVPIDSEEYDYIFLIYQKEFHRLIIFEYSFQYFGGVI